MSKMVPCVLVLGSGLSSDDVCVQRACALPRGELLGVELGVKITESGKHRITGRFELEGASKPILIPAPAVGTTPPTSPSWFSSPRSGAGG